MSNPKKMSLIFVVGLVLVALVMVVSARSGKSSPLDAQLKNGDVIFQSLNSSAGEAIQLATAGKFSHCGILYQEEGKWLVFEAIGPVKLTPLEDWIERGREQQYEIKRLHGAAEILNSSVLKNMQTVAEGFAGKDYDTQFGWSDARIYCSELVWKIYKRGAGIKLGNLRALKDYKLQSRSVQNALKQRYGQDVPWEELMISPQGIYESPLLKTVARS